jgi:predicted unusual protein kinase regulating ubiquinone biosynthesis (AarF/ABC1/UbiB family)
VPGVVDDLCGRRVLTTELSHGVDFQTFCDEAPRQQKDAAAAEIFSAAFTCIFRHCVYNGDPHPGNYLFEDGRVVFIDFGCVKRFDVGFVDRWKRLVRVVLDGRRRDFKEAVDRTGVVAMPRLFDYDYHWELMQYLYQPFLSAEPFTYTHEYVSRSYDVIIFRNPNKLSTTMPPDWLFVQRLQWGLNSVLASLDATARWGDLLREAVETPTEPVR